MAYVCAQSKGRLKKRGFQRCPYFSEDHDFIVVYAKHRDGWKPGLLARTDEQDAAYKNPDNDPRGVWKTGDLSARNPYSAGVYSLTCPGGRVISGPPEGRYWVISEPKFREWDKDKRIWWGKDGNSVPQVKKFLTEVKQGRVPQTLWFYDDVGHTDESKKEVKEIVGFETREEGTITPKPSRLIQRILEIATDKDSLILDSFAGSGTTAHAVLALNAKDGGKRRFILCETEAYADTLTAERVRRVIRGYEFSGTQQVDLMDPVKVTWTTFAKDKARNEVLDRIEGIENLERGNYDKIEKKITDGVLTVVGQRQVKEKMPGLGGSFTYVELGEAMDLERLLAETPGALPGFAALARYLFFTATGHTLVEQPGRDGQDGRDGQAKRGKAKGKGRAKPVPTDDPVLIGETAVWRVYLHYRPDLAWLRSPAAAFTRTQAEAIAAESKGTGKQALVFAAAKFINHRSLRGLKVDFAQLPYALHRVQAE